MNNPIFSRADFTLCEVPVPQGYPQSQTHSGIAFYGDEFYLVTSPYPNKHRSPWEIRARILFRKLTFGLLHRLEDGEYFENPCLYRGLPTIDNEIPYRFVPIADNPLVPTPKSPKGLPAFNSDPDLFIENGLFHILNRTVYRTKITENGYESQTVISMLKGKIDDGRFNTIDYSRIKVWEKPYASPCLTKYKGKYVFTYLDTNSAIDSSTFNGLFVQMLDFLDELPTNQQFVRVNVNAEDLLPWHMSLFQHHDVLYTVIACVKKGDKTRKIWQMLGEFNPDLTELTIYPTPLTDFNSYRGSALVTKNGVFALYSTTVWEDIKGSKSVDGRDVIVAKMPFEYLLGELRTRR